MSRTLSAVDLCGRALRLIGAWPVTDSAPDGEHLREALSWLDLNMAEISGVKRFFNHIKDNLPIALTAGKDTYPLIASMGAFYPLEGVQFPVAAYLERNGSKLHDITIVTRETWRMMEGLPGSGDPSAVFIDRFPQPTMRVWPMPADNDATIRLHVQTNAPNVSPGGVTGTIPDASAVHSFRAAWQRFLIYRLAGDLGRGAVVKLPQGSLQEYRTEATIAERQLDAFENRQHDNEPPIVRSYDSYYGGAAGRPAARTPARSGADDADGYTIILD